MAADFGPCAAWPVHWPVDVTTESPAVTGAAVDAATEIVWALSGQRFGECEVTLRPCRPSCLATPFPDGWMPWPGTGFGAAYAGSYGGWWFPPGCSSCAGSCSCTSLPEIRLPAPVSEIVQVKVDGAVLVTGAYRLDDNRKLVRLDGQTWPYCNELRLADTEDGTWSVTARYGEVVPESGKWAVGEMAGEYIKASRGEDCRLPRNLASLARQGVTIQLPMLTDLLREGRTGLPMVDYFLAAVNPDHLRGRARTYSVDQALARRAGS